MFYHQHIIVAVDGTVTRALQLNISARNLLLSRAHRELRSKSEWELRSLNDDRILRHSLHKTHMRTRWVVVHARNVLYTQHLATPYRRTIPT